MVAGGFFGNRFLIGSRSSLGVAAGAVASTGEALKVSSAGFFAVLIWLPMRLLRRAIMPSSMPPVSTSSGSV